MKKRRKPTPKTPFERETERRRRMMLRDLAGPTVHSNEIPKARLKRLIGEGVKVVIGQDKDGNDIELRKGYPHRNIFRDMAGHKAPQRGARA